MIHIKKLAGLYLLINVLSLDVAAGAVISGIFFGWVFNVSILSWGLLCLGLTVWIIYTIDHLSDAVSVTEPAASHRHRFHQEHFRALVIVLLIAILADGMMVTLIRRPVLQWGLILSGAVLVYFLVQRYLKYFKELFGALLYCLGVMLPALSLSNGSVQTSEGFIIAQFALTVLSNLILFSLLDFQRDRQDHHHSLATSIGEVNTTIVLSVLFIVNAALLTLSIVYHLFTIRIGVTLALMNILLLLIFLLRARLKAAEWFRMLGDAVFYLPLLLLI